MSPASPTSTRRSLLTAIAATGGAASTAGCLDRIRGVASRDTGERLSLEIKAPPADEDPVAIRIAQALRDNLHAAGVGARVTPVAIDELYRQVLINNEFDVYVGQYPTRQAIDPDDLYPLLHSKFTGEPGWQNPFGCTDLAIDDLLDRQRRTTGEARYEAVTELQRVLGNINPFSILAFPDAISAVREGRFEGWLGGTGGFDTPLGLLGLDRIVDSGSDDDDASDPTTDHPDRLRLTTTDERITKNRNPLAVEFRNDGLFTSLLYDSLARRYGGEVRPWLAADWTWDDEMDGEWTETAAAGDAADAGGSATLRLREGLRWHDGEPITADDVEFTYDFLTDTSMGELDSPAPAPRFRGRSSLVASARTTDDLTAVLSFTTPSRSIAVRALTVPLLPEHIWREHTGVVDVPGLDTDGVTDALVWMNPEPVGSGPLTFERATEGESVLFSRYQDHFLAAADPPADVAERFHGKPAFDELSVMIAPSDWAAVELAAEGDVDATVSQLSPGTVPRIGRSDALRLISSRSWSFYHIGFNMRHSPLTNPHFRKAVSNLLDAEAVASNELGGYARPAATPLAGTDWEAPGLQWDAETRAAEFYGEDGELDVESAREAFREAGYRYDEEGRLRQ